MEQVRTLALSNIPREAFLQQFFDKLAIALGAEGGGIWLYVQRDQRLICELNRIPDVVAIGDLNPENVNQVVTRAITDDIPILVSRAEMPEGNPSAGQDISVVCVAFPLDEGVSGALLLYRDASDGRYFTRDSVFLCQSLMPFLALHAARNTSRQVVTQTRRLGALSELAADLASTQDPERVAYLTTNRVPSVVPCERAYLAVVRGERLRVLSISGHDEVHQGSAQVEALKALASWGARQAKDWYLSEDTVAASDDDELKERFEDYRTATSMNSCLLVLLREPPRPGAEQGDVLGVLVLESRESRVYGPADMSVLGLVTKLLSATLDRARQYARLPAIGLLEGVSKLRSRPSVRARFLRWSIILVTLAAAMVFGKLPFWAGGACEIVPRKRALITSRVGGLIQEVLVRENDRVARGDLLFQLDERPFLLRLTERTSALAASERRLDALRASDQAGYQEELANYQTVQAEVERLQDELQRTRITSFIDGVVLTPELENLVGSYVNPGTRLCEVASLEDLELEVAVPEELIGYVKVGQSVNFMLSSYPGQERTATVKHIRLRSQPKGQKNTFVTICSLGADEATFRPGMTGWAKISTGKQRAGFVLFRRVIAWVQMKLMF